MYTLLTLPWFHFFFCWSVVGNGQSVATIPAGLGGSSTGTPVQFTPGAAASTTPSPYYVATNAAESSTLASLNTHFSQAISAPTPTTGPPTGISTGVPGGFTGSNTVSILDGSITTIPNAATTYTGPRSSSTSSQGQSSPADSLYAHTPSQFAPMFAAALLALVTAASCIL